MKTRKTSRSKQPAVYAFIDSQNLNLGVKSQGWNLDFGKFRIFLKEKYNVKKAFLFIGYIPTNRKLYTYLKKSDYLIIFKPVLKSSGHKKAKVKGNVDAELVLYTMIEFPNYDKAIIVSGDGDFYCLADYLVKKGKLGKIIVPNSKYSSLLRKFASFIVNINLFREKVKS
ncbi:NYN domain-containing protein [Candidatus Curtissbacteria bacterium]|nr:NYN domain-containing protein [Candidatus Curtissbacteria bacterium]